MSETKDYPPYLDYPKPRSKITWADKIRQMSDEELAQWLADCAYWISQYEGKAHAILHILQQEVEE